MSLTKLQKLGAILAFIPVVSTVVGAIHIYYYSKQIKKHDQLMRESLNVNAVTIHDKAQATFKASTYQRAVWYKSDEYSASVFELIPGVNIFAAIHGAITHNRWSKIQAELELLKDLDAFLLNHYQAPNDLGVKQRTILLDAFKHLYVRLDSTPYSLSTRSSQDKWDSPMRRKQFAQMIAQDLIKAVKEGYENSEG